MEDMVGNWQELFKDKKVFVTGHTGFKGAWFSLLLYRLGAEVHGYALAPPTQPSLFQEARMEELLASHTIGDVKDYSHLQGILNKVRPDVLIHMAAQPLVRESYLHPVETYATNVMGTVNVLEAARHTDSIRVVLNVTTDKCYENKEWLWGYRENEPMGGYDPYSNSKSCSELVTTSYRNSFFNAKEYGKSHRLALASARAGNVIGGGDWAGDRLIPDFIRAISNKEKISIRSPHAIRPWQHVLEPLSGYLTLCANLWTNGVQYAEGWNLGPEDNDAKPVEWIVDKICTLWGDGAGYVIDSNPQPHEASFLKLDCSKAKNRLGWYPRWNIEKTLESIVHWTKAYHDGQDMRRICTEQIDEYLKYKV